MQEELENRFQLLATRHAVQQVQFLVAWCSARAKQRNMDFATPRNSLWVTTEISKANLLSSISKIVAVRPYYLTTLQLLETDTEGCCGIILFQTSDHRSHMICSTDWASLHYTMPARQYLDHNPPKMWKRTGEQLSKPVRSSNSTDTASFSVPT